MPAPAWMEARPSASTMVRMVMHESRLPEKLKYATAARGLEAVDQLHGPDLRRAGERAGGERGEERIDGRAAAAQAAAYVGDQMHDVAVALDVAEVSDLDRAAGADAPEIVAAEVDEHEVLGALFRVDEKALLELEVGLARGAARQRAGDGARLHVVAGDAHQHLRRRADQRALRGAQQEHVRRRIDRAQRAVERQRVLRIERRGPTLRQHDLEDLAGDDPLLRSAPHAQKRRAIHAG